MNLYLLRHGKAESHDVYDPDRQLTDKGRRDVRAVAAKFAARSISLQRCFASPFVRAQQTAAEFLAAINSELAIETWDCLTPSANVNEVFARLEQLADQEVLLVSHNPLVTELYAVLTEGRIDYNSVLRTSDLCSVSMEMPAPGLGYRGFWLHKD